MTKSNPSHLVFVAEGSAATIPDAATVGPDGYYSAATVVTRGFELELTPQYLEALERLRSDWVTAALASGRWVAGRLADHPELADALAADEAERVKKNSQARTLEARRYGRLERAERQAQARADAVADYRAGMAATTAGSVQ